MSDLGAKAAVSRSMVGQAYLLAAVDMFTVSAWLCVLGIVLVWLCHQARAARDAAARPTKAAAGWIERQR